MLSGPEGTFIMLPVLLCVPMSARMDYTLLHQRVIWKLASLSPLLSLVLPPHRSLSTSISVCFAPRNRLCLGPFCVCLSFCYRVSFCSPPPRARASVSLTSRLPRLSGLSHWLCDESDRGWRCFRRFTAGSCLCQVQRRKERDERGLGDREKQMEDRAVHREMTKGERVREWNQRMRAKKGMRKRRLCRGAKKETEEENVSRVWNRKRGYTMFCCCFF